MGALPPISTLALKINQSFTLTARVLDNAGNAMLMDNPVWTSSDPSILEVTREYEEFRAQAVIMGISPGVATLTINSKGLTKLVTVTVTTAIPTTLNIHAAPLP